MQRRQMLREITNAASQTALMNSLSEKNAREEMEKGGGFFVPSGYFLCSTS